MERNKSGGHLPLDGQALMQVQLKDAVRVDVMIDQRRQSPEVLGRHLVEVGRGRQHLLDHQRVDVYQTSLQKVQRQHCDLLILQAVRGDLAAFAVEDEAVGAVPVLNHVESFVNGLAERLGIQVAAKKDGLDRLAQLGQGPVRGMLEVVAGKAAQNRFGLGRPKAQRRGELDHFIVLLADQFPVDRARQDGLQIRVVAGAAPNWTIKLLRGDGLEPRQEVKAQEVAEGKADFALAVAVDVLLLDLHLGAVAQDALDHGGDLGGRAALELRVDTGGFSLHVPVDHDPAAAMANVPLGHQVLIPGAELLAVGRARGGAFPPDVAQARRQRGIDHAPDGFPQGVLFNESMSRIGKHQKVWGNTGAVPMDGDMIHRTPTATPRPSVSSWVAERGLSTRL